jgi:nucleoside-diphosphate-sugar epimerase
VVELAELCGRAAGVEQPEVVHAAERPGELRRSLLDPVLAERELGFRADTPLEDGLRATWHWLAGDDAAPAK